jgi:N,N-dimethylformamidase
MDSDLKNLPAIIGYVTPFSGRPGDNLSIKISSQAGRDFSAEVVRIDCCDPNPAGPGMKLVPVDFALQDHYAGSEQPAYSGSCAVGLLPPLDGVRQLVVELTVQPTLISGEMQTLLSLQNETGTRGLAIGLRNGQIVFQDLTSRSIGVYIATGLDIPVRRWTRLRIILDKQQHTSIEASEAGLGDAARTAHVELAMNNDALDASINRICLAAIWLEQPEQTFNGLIEAPALFAADDESSGEGAAALRTIARWDFSQSIDQQWVPDSVDNSRRLVLVNLPGRGVRSSKWTGRHMDWKTAPPDEYAAIYFHSDDLLDCEWKTSVDLRIPAGTPSGVYGLIVRNGVGTDTIPFYVTPSAAGPRARILFLAPTLTYVAYANYVRGNFAGALAERVEQWGAYPNHPDVFTTYGASTYNRHPDGSGISISSRLRPILTMRPGFLTFLDECGSGMRHFPADSHLTDWLREKGYAFDVITDEDLDDQGVAALAGYDVVLTGSHPEYYTRRMLDALLSYRADGGNLMYLGGNGFYWKIARSTDLPHAIEIRRGEGGLRPWASEPGEYYNQLDGEYGGLWRRNGIPPQRVAGVGFAVQGAFEGSYYKRTPASFRSDLSWLFEGVAAESGARLGDFGLSGGGAAGFELDQASTQLGTPDYVSIVAVSEAHGPTFKIAPEEILTWLLPADNSREYDGMRAHMVYGVSPNGSGLFAVGSISFLGSLSHNKYDNDISRIMENCLRRFCASAAVRRGSEP